MSIYWALVTERAKYVETKANAESPVVRPCIFNSRADAEMYAKARANRFPEPLYVIPVLVSSSSEGLLAAMAAGPIRMEDAGEAARGGEEDAVSGA